MTPTPSGTDPVHQHLEREVARKFSTAAVHAASYQDRARFKRELEEAALEIRTPACPVAALSKPRTVILRQKLQKSVAIVRQSMGPSPLAAMPEIPGAKPMEGTLK